MSKADPMAAAERHAHMAGVEARTNGQGREAAPDVLGPKLLAAWHQGWDTTAKANPLGGDSDAAAIPPAKPFDLAGAAAEEGEWDATGPSVDHPPASDDEAGWMHLAAKLERGEADGLPNNTERPTAAERLAYAAGAKAKRNGQPQEAAPSALAPNLLSGWMQGWEYTVIDGDTDTEGVNTDEETMDATAQVVMIDQFVRNAREAATAAGGAALTVAEEGARLLGPLRTNLDISAACAEELGGALLGIESIAVRSAGVADSLATTVDLLDEAMRGQAADLEIALREIEVRQSPAREWGRVLAPLLLGLVLGLLLASVCWMAGLLVVAY